MDFIENFSRFKKDLVQKPGEKKKEKLGRGKALADWMESNSVMSEPSNDKYREGWARTFGKKTGDTISEQSEDVSQ